MLAGAGLGSRRQIERWIEQGRIVVDGQRAGLGDRLRGGERVLLDGKPVGFSSAQRRAHEFLAYYKPVGQVTTRKDPEGRPTVFSSVRAPRRGRWVSVGRLDIATSGLLLLTTDGELAHRLMHPSYQISREYAVRVLGTPSASQLQTLRDGIELDDGPARVEDLVPAGGSGTNVWFRATLREGRYREIRRLFEAAGMQVSRLIRVRYGPLPLGRLRRGEQRPLSSKEIAALYEAVGMPRP